VEAYYPPQKITPKIAFGIQEIMNKVNSEPETPPSGTRTNNTAKSKPRKP